ncbi:hypothetical protein CROQUDRAFT_94586 [Cronartium quercuum f. sp. fusiforme G11]|uniref:non-specific serine/threonine protein kinase n=1 Tax=Cronartium quercuum f. sp. fusiforme G11 TaxID=708437 RepID=A0A9P6NDM1_9BASI|nr:hypothetical protein CROQUDRAFT_94586 [Cronartium quercuum f. sp. fusiforme G11]
MTNQLNTDDNSIPQLWSTFNQPSTRHSKLTLKRFNTCPLTSPFSIEKLGKGSFGSVFKATRLADGKACAIKLLKKGEPMIEKEITNEFMVMCSFDPEFPLLTQLYGWYSTPQEVGLVMELVDGGDLLTLVKKNDGLSEDKARDFTAKVAKALDYLHKNNIIYRDLKLANVPYRDIVELSTREPEVIVSRPYTYLVDRYGLGIFLYQMSDYCYPFNPTKIFTLKQSIICSDIHIPSTVSIPCQEVIRALLEKRASSRPNSLEALLA